MLRLIFVLVALCVVIGLIPTNALAADPFLVSQALFYADFPIPGSVNLEIYIHNTNPESQDITIAPWYDGGNWYAYPLGEQQWMDVSWISNITPNSAILPPGLKSLINVTITLPDGVPDGKYVGWLKI